MQIDPINTERLKIEPQELKHAQGLFDGFKDSRLNKFTSRGPIGSIDTLKRGIEMLSSRESTDGKRFLFNWVLTRKEDGKVVGQIEISLPKKEKEFNLAYTIFFEHWKNGYAKEACEGVLQYMSKKFKELTARIEMDTRNIASIKLAESLKATRVELRKKSLELFSGELSDEFVYKLRLEDL